jgi:4-amino-4-deoxy-L-arabinose transferase-like glycosyltransferase
MDGLTLPDAEATFRRRCCWVAALLVLSAAALRLLFLGWNCPLDLAPDEAHYWDWSRHLDWSYYSKGPGVAWLIRLSCELFGRLSTALTGNEMLAVRLPAVVCGSLLLVSLYILTMQVSGRPGVALALLVIGLTMPAFAAGSSLMTIDSPYACCWGWALVFGYRAVFPKNGTDHICRNGPSGASHKWGLSPFLVAGALVALGILFKYTMVVWLPSLGLFLLFSPARRRLLWSGGFWLMIGAASLSAVPILIWNAQHDWVTFHHVGGLAGLTDDQPTIHWLGPLKLLGVQCGLWLVFWFVVWLRAMWAHAPWRKSPASYQYLWWMSAPMFGTFFLFGFKTDGGEPNWPITAYLSGLVLGGLWLVDELRTAGGWYRRLALGSLAAAVLAGISMTLVVHFSAAIAPLLLPLAGPPTAEQPYPLRRLDPTLRLRGWRCLAEEVDRRRLALRERQIEPVLATTGWNMPGLVGFYCAGHPTVYSLGPAFGDRHSQYDFWQPNPLSNSSQFAGRTFIIVTGAPMDLRGVFERVEVYPVRYEECGHAVAGWTILVCYGYRGFGAGADFSGPHY